MPREQNFAQNLLTTDKEDKEELKDEPKPSWSLEAFCISFGLTLIRFITLMAK